jgi:hypothetical protein
MLAVELPTHDSIRKADFGEVITSSLFSYRLGLEVPFEKLESMRPSANVTVQGPDVMALTLTDHTTPAPTLVESKFRSTISPAEVLGDIQRCDG